MIKIKTHLPLRDLWFPLIHSPKVLRNGVNILLLLSLGLVVWLTAQAIYRWSRPIASMPQSTSPSVAPISDRALGNQLAAMHLFGEWRPEQKITTANDTVVAGIVHAAEGRDSHAILVVNGNQRRYTIGDILPTGEQLIGIDLDRVSLERNGTRYAIALEIRHANPNANFDYATTAEASITATASALPLPLLQTPTSSAADTANKLRILRQNVTVPTDLLAGKKSEPANKIRAEHQSRIPAGPGQRR